MLRFVNTLLLVVMGALVVLLYQLKYESRQLEKRVSKIILDIADERDNIAVRKAEWSLMTRPGRVERLAKKHLGLKPVSATQYVDKEWLETLKAPGGDIPAVGSIQRERKSRRLKSRHPEGN